MRTQSPDTHPDAEKVQVDLLRNLSSAQLVEMGSALTEMAVAMARQNLREKHPDASEREISCLFVEQAYGVELGRRYRDFLARKSS